MAAIGGPACTPTHCTLGEVGAMYSSASFLVGLAAIAVVAALFLSPRTRLAGRVGVVLLLVAALIGMGLHHG